MDTRAFSSVPLSLSASPDTCITLPLNKRAGQRLPGDPCIWGGGVPFIPGLFILKMLLIGQFKHLGERGVFFSPALHPYSWRIFKFNLCATSSRACFVSVVAGFLSGSGFNSSHFSAFPLSSPTCSLHLFSGWFSSKHSLPLLLLQHVCLAALYSVS